MLHWAIPCEIIQGISPLPHGFCRIFTSGRYHRDMKVLKILASNFRRFRVSGIFKKLQVDDDKWGPPNRTIT